MSTTKETPAIEVQAEIITTGTLNLIGPGYSMIIPPEAEKRKAALIASSSAIVEIVTDAHYDEALEEIKALVKFRTDTDRGRKACKAPVAEWVDTHIDGKAKTFAAEPLQHEDRLRKLTAEYATAKEQARQAEARRLQQLERERAEAERLAEVARAKAQADKEKAEREAKAAEEEAARLAAMPAAVEEDPDDAAFAAFEAEEAAKAKRAEIAAQEEAERLAEKKRQAEAAERAAHSRSVSILAGAAPKGVTFPIAFEVEDAAELYKVRPDLFTLTPKAREILAYVKAEEAKMDGQLPTIPGLRIYRETKVGSR